MPAAAAAVAATMLHLFVTHLDYRWEFSAVVIRPSILSAKERACATNTFKYIEGKISFMISDMETDARSLSRWSDNISQTVSCETLCYK